MIDQWKTEIEKIAPRQFKVLDVYGVASTHCSKSDFQSSDIILSTMDTFPGRIINTNKHWDDYNGEYYYSYKRRYYDGIKQFKSGFFSRLVIDEGHGIAPAERGRKLAAFCAIKGIKTRWAVTGTPINNDGMFNFCVCVCLSISKYVPLQSITVPRDLAGMSMFIGVPYANFLAAINMDINIRVNKSVSRKIFLNLDNEDCIDKIKQYLLPIMIRRTRDHPNDNGLPEKITKVMACELNEEERFLYDAVQTANKSTTEFCIHPSLTIDEADMQAMLSMLAEEGYDVSLIERVPQKW